MRSAIHRGLFILACILMVSLGSALQDSVAQFEECTQSSCIFGPTKGYDKNCVTLVCDDCEVNDPLKAIDHCVFGFGGCNRTGVKAGCPGGKCKMSGFSCSVCFDHCK
jgi:hypothetical protein